MIKMNRKGSYWRKSQKMWNQEEHVWGGWGDKREEKRKLIFLCNSENNILDSFKYLVGHNLTFNGITLFYKMEILDFAQISTQGWIDFILNVIGIIRTTLVTVTLTWNLVSSRFWECIEKFLANVAHTYIWTLDVKGHCDLIYCEVSWVFWPV